ncbi:MAG: hypothetical protein J5594_00920 [Elusimicrobiaceae bacterium]|nr:hypothetical protein [Elusimicrobiaceae bacterium]
MMSDIPKYKSSNNVLNNKCLFCGKTLTDNEKPEHILPNSIGGKLKCKNIICSDCNSKMSCLDKALSDGFIYFTNLACPKKDNGEIPVTQWKMGEKVINRLPDGSLQYFKIDSKRENGSLKINIHLLQSPNSKAESINQQKINNILNTSINDLEKREKLRQKLKKQVEIKNNLPNPILKCEFSSNRSDLLMLSMLKIATEFYASLGKAPQYITNIIEIVNQKNYKEANKICNYYFGNQVGNNNGIFHFILLKGDSTNKILFCIISIYNLVDIFILLNENYIGENFEETYVENIFCSQNINVVMPCINLTEAKRLLSEKFNIRTFEEKIKSFLNHCICSPMGFNNLANKIHSYMFCRPEPIQEQVFCTKREEIFSAILHKDCIFQQFVPNTKERILKRILNLPMYTSYSKYIDEFYQEQTREKKILFVYSEIIKKVINLRMTTNTQISIELLNKEIDNYAYDDEIIKQWILDHRDILSDILRQVTTLMCGKKNID